MAETPKGTILLHRVRDGLGVMRELDIVVDGEQLMPVAYGADVTLNLTAGRHNIFAKLDWYRSRPIEVNVHSGESLELYCWSRLAGRHSLSDILAFIFSPRSFYTIGSDPGRHITVASEDKKRLARKFALVLTPILLIPVLGILRVAGMLLVYFSDQLGSFATPVLFFFIVCYIAAVIWTTRACYRWLKSYLEENPVS